MLFTKLLVLMQTLCLCNIVMAYTAARDLNVDYTELEKQAMDYEAQQGEKLLFRKTPLNSSQKWPTFISPPVTIWKKPSLQERFEKIRDTRFIDPGSRPPFLRRSSWLYPDDGCFARAALAVKNTFTWFFPTPKKIFVFGNLRVKTNYSRRGVVGWWFHVAPIVESQGQKYVLDPSLDFLAPLPIEEWLKKMGDPSKMKVAICSSGTYYPGDDCQKETDGLERGAHNTQLYYLGLERQRVISLGKDPNSELGEEPPWR